jgi:hypothetical protein
VPPTRVSAISLSRHSTTVHTSFVCVRTINAGSFRLFQQVDRGLFGLVKSECGNIVQRYNQLLLDWTFSGKTESILHDQGF